MRSRWATRTSVRNHVPVTGGGLCTLACPIDEGLESRSGTTLAKRYALSVRTYNPIFKTGRSFRQVPDEHEGESFQQHGRQRRASHRYVGNGAFYASPYF